MSKNNSAALVTIQFSNDNEATFNNELEEFKLLIHTLNYKISHICIQKRNKIDTSTYIGKGKINQLSNLYSELKINTIFINAELKPSHYKNIQKLLGNNKYIIDRNHLILTIFPHV